MVFITRQTSLKRQRGAGETNQTRREGPLLWSPSLCAGVAALRASMKCVSCLTLSDLRVWNGLTGSSAGRAVRRLGQEGVHLHATLVISSLVPAVAGGGFWLSPSAGCCPRPLQLTCCPSPKQEGVLPAGGCAHFAAGSGDPLARWPCQADVPSRACAVVDGPSALPPSTGQEPRGASSSHTQEGVLQKSGGTRRQESRGPPSQPAAVCFPTPPA